MNRLSHFTEDVSRRAKGKILRSLKLDQRLMNWDDEDYLRLLYRIRMGRRLNLHAPTAFTEKLQWLKLHDRNPYYSRLVDKYAAKTEVAEILGAENIVPTLGVWSDASEINFSALPNQFVLKVNHNSGGVLVCRDKRDLDVASTVERFNGLLSRSYYWPGREWPYRDVRPVIFAEKYLSPDPALSADSATDAGPSSIVDYKFFCFHGEPRFLNVQQDMDDHHAARFAFMNTDWTFANFGRTEYPRYDRLPRKPGQFEQMLAYARKLAADIPFVRVDFFQHQGHVLFSEMTFFPTSGMIPFDPKVADEEIGSWLDLKQVRFTREN